MNARLDKLRKFLDEQSLDGVIVNKPENRRYFSGFSGTAGILLIGKTNADLITDFRYVEQAAKQASCFQIVKHQKSMIGMLNEVIQRNGFTKVGFEGDFFTYNEFAELAKLMQGVSLKSIELDALRAIKDEAELNDIKTAVAISDKAFEHILSFIKPGVSEAAVAVELENCMRSLGSQKPAFDTIVASGVRSSLPHGVASEKQIECGDFVTMDFGAVYNGYHSDITRTICVGKANPKQREIYHLVLEAQLAGIAALKPGKTGKAVDDEVRRILIKANLGQYFGHGLGHGVGLAIHELPRLSPSSTCENLQENMVVTIEPGVYLPDWCGVRIEDTVVVTALGCDSLTKSSKHLIEL